MLKEKEKYDEIWEKVEEYRNFSPGLQNVERFFNILEPSIGESLIDIGCGEGKAGLEFQKFGLRVKWLDVSDKGLSFDIKKKDFYQTYLWSNWRHYLNGSKFDYGFCCDVMEHIPTEYVMLCLDRIFKNCHTSWLQISFVEDNLGSILGKSLHLTVKPFEWWLERIEGFEYKILDARDLCESGLFIVNSDRV